MLDSRKGATILFPRVDQQPWQDVLSFAEVADDSIAGLFVSIDDQAKRHLPLMAQLLESQNRDKLNDWCVTDIYLDSHRGYGSGQKRQLYNSIRSTAFRQLSDSNRMERAILPSEKDFWVFMIRGMIVSYLRSELLEETKKAIADAAKT